MSYSLARRFPHALRSLVSHEVLRIAVLLGTAAFLADWASKSWALHNVAQSTMPFGVFNLGVAFNDGFAFSTAAGAAPAWAILTIRLSVIAVLLVVTLRYALDCYRAACGAALLLAGGLGNAIDLVARNGAVVDFIGAGPFTFTLGAELYYMHLVFNLADVFIVAGIVMIAPLIRRLSLGTQRRLAAWEQRVLQGDEAATR